MEIQKRLNTKHELDAFVLQIASELTLDSTLSSRIKIKLSFLDWRLDCFECYSRWHIDYKISEISNFNILHLDSFEFSLFNCTIVCLKKPILKILSRY